MSRYAEPGPYRTATFPFNIPLGSGQSGPLSMKLEVIHPVGQLGRSPLAIVSPGFLLDSDTFRRVD
jgi:hypothetical protein